MHEACVYTTTNDTQGLLTRLTASLALRNTCHACQHTMNRTDRNFLYNPMSHGIVFHLKTRRESHSLGLSSRTAT